MLTAPTKLPHFSVISDNDQIVSSDSLLGSWTILYFYPKDETSGCTAQACSIRDHFAEFTKRGIAVYGISGDSVKSHKKFKTNHKLPFTLLADPDHSMARSFEVWIEKSMYGKKYMGMERSRALVSPEGMIVAAYPKVSPEEHASFLLKEIEKYLLVNTNNS